MGLWAAGGAAGNVDLAPVIWWGLAVVIIASLAVTLAVRVAWGIGRRRPPRGPDRE